MRFEDVPAGVERQINGPIFGVRVLSRGEGSWVRVNGGITLPASVLLTWIEEFDRLQFGGPCVLAIADEEGDDLAGATASPLPPSPQGEDPYRWMEVRTPAAGNYAAASIIIPEVTRPDGADSFELIQLAGVRPYPRLDFRYGSDSWTRNVTLISAVPGAYCRFTPALETAPAAGSNGLATLGSNGSGMPAPDGITLRVNDGGPFFACTGDSKFLFLWWRVGGSIR